MDKVKEMFNELNLDRQLTLGEIPDIDLYMDQVTQLFENRFMDSKRSPEDKALTKTMVNNYAKAKLLMTVKNKKYSKEHLILMSIIYNLKGALSIQDIKSTVNKIVQYMDNDEKYPLRELYACYLEQYEKDLAETEKHIEEKAKLIKDEISNKEDLEGEFEENFLLLSSLVNMSNMYRRMSEKLIDDYFNKLENK